jgi:hypothetical protein
VQVPALGLTVDEERVGVAGRAHADVVQRRLGQGEVEQDQLVPLLGQRADADVVRLDVPVDDPMPLQRGDRREEVVAVSVEHLQARHALGSQHGRERLVAGLLEDEHGPAAHDQLVLNGDDELAVDRPQGLGLLVQADVLIRAQRHLEDGLLIALLHEQGGGGRPLAQDAFDDEAVFEPVTPLGLEGIDDDGLRGRGQLVLGTIEEDQEILDGSGPCGDVGMGAPLD